MDHGHLIREQRYALLAVRAVQKSLPLDTPVGDSQYAVFGELDSSRFMDIKVSSFKQSYRSAMFMVLQNQGPASSTCVPNTFRDTLIQLLFAQGGSVTAFKRDVQDVQGSADAQQRVNRVEMVASLGPWLLCVFPRVASCRLYESPESWHNYFRDKFLCSQ
jgi:hypothetical protein